MIIVKVYVFPEKAEEVDTVVAEADLKQPAVPIRVEPAVIEKNISLPVVQKPQPAEIAEVVEQEEPESEEPENKNFVLCEHVISGNSQFEFMGEIRMTNKGAESIYGWSVNWEYEDGSTIFESSDVALGGNNPYTGEYLSWNAEIAPGKTVKFKFSGIKGEDDSPKNVKVLGEFCM
ncbi:cellulose binding domain-containing protein [Teredinibacter purpureus]|uniref:cellulose binding domain-containing protein n=1 Tax=Teredinibacter purpureus TaxID=2731756 RepID=UPI000698BD20|nr:cellulose binding domain-containing protein [Teredinibacter purpureus]